MTPIPARPRTYHVAGRTPGTGPVIAVLTDGPADVAVAEQAADLAARTGTLLITAAAVTTSADHSMNALLHRAWAGRIVDERRAITGRVAPSCTPPASPTSAPPWTSRQASTPPGRCRSPRCTT